MTILVPKRCQGPLLYSQPFFSLRMFMFNSNISGVLSSIQSDYTNIYTQPYKTLNPQKSLITKHINISILIHTPTKTLYQTNFQTKSKNKKIKNTHRFTDDHIQTPPFKPKSKIKNHQIFVTQKKKTQSLNQPRPEPTKEEENDQWRFRCDSLPVVVAEVVGLVPLTFGTQTQTQTQIQTEAQIQTLSSMAVEHQSWCPQHPIGAFSEEPAAALARKSLKFLDNCFHGTDSKRESKMIVLPLWVRERRERMRGREDRASERENRKRLRKREDMVLRGEAENE